ncbi:hypothetical protein ACFQO4_03030 [Saliphagus sp. GCM10025334]
MTYLLFTTVVLYLLQSEVEDPDEHWLIEVLLAPFRGLAEVVIWEFSQILMNTPTIYPNPAVEEIHQLLFVLAMLSLGLVVIVVGLYLIAYPSLDIHPERIWKILPKLVLMLLFASVSLPVLQLGIELSDALVYAFRPPQFETTLTEMAGFSTALALTVVINSMLILGLVVIFIIRNAYLLIVGAMAPVIAVAWTLPSTQRYARSLVSGWFTALALAPLDMLILRFSFEMMKGTAGFGLQGISNWIIGVSSFALMYWLPFQLYGASQAAIVRGTRIANNLRPSKPPKRPGSGGSGLNEEEIRRVRRNQRRRRRGGGRGGI